MIEAKSMKKHIAVKEIPYYPCLKIAADGCIVLFTTLTTGVCLKEGDGSCNHPGIVGEIDEWEYEDFTLYTGMLGLSNRRE
ncbi:MAG: hypothetical protein EHM41_00195 [Chloroflexi bacterium]|nr:MAG: hypothetical protein EHM41_00195 [Chloroflexota bacterium]